MSFVLYFSIKNADIDYRYGDYSKMYHQYDDAKEYFVIIDENKTGFLLKYGDVLLIEDDKCLTRLTDYISSEVTIYEFIPGKTFESFTIKEAKELRADKTTRLVFEKKIVK